MPSGRYSMLYHRVYTAAMHLWRAALVKYPRRGFRQLTEDGKRLLKNLPAHLDLKYVRSLSAYEQWQDNSRALAADEGSSSIDAGLEVTPEVVHAFQRLDGELQADLLTRVRQAHPSFLEQVVVDLLIAMGLWWRRC